MDQLLASLLDLLAELDRRGITLTVGGGFGLYLKRRHLEETKERTLFAELPELRSTNDLDLFLRAEVLASLDRSREVAEVIRSLGYVPVEQARFLQWKRSVRVGGLNQEVKIDVLVGPLGKYRGKCSVTKPRVRPKRDKGEIEFHAYLVEEALGVEEEPIAVRLAGSRTSGAPYEGTVLVPQAFPYLLMKLHAFDDRKDEQGKDLGRHHALDLYTIVGMMTEREYERAQQFGARSAGDKHMARARQIVEDCFGEPTASGVLRLREHRLFRDAFRLDEFIATLKDIFSAGESSPPVRGAGP
jgi:hypothetical protein